MRGLSVIAFLGSLAASAAAQTAQNATLHVLRDGGRIVLRSRAEGSAGPSLASVAATDATDSRLPSHTPAHGAGSPSRVARADSSNFSGANSRHQASIPTRASCPPSRTAITDPLGATSPAGRGNLRAPIRSSTTLTFFSGSLPGFVTM